MNTLMVDRMAIVAAARRYIGTPFEHQGRMHGVGVDCAGLLTCVAYDLRLRDVRVTDYGRLPDGERARQIIEQHMDPIAYSDLAPGDVVSFAFMHSVQHFGIVTTINPIRFVHSYQTVGKVVEQALAGPWLHRLRGCYRFREAAPWCAD
jgi:cell wall-associated NlpC family hydrolase